MQSRIITVVHWISLGLLGCSSPSNNNLPLAGIGGTVPNGTNTANTGATGGAPSSATGGARTILGGAASSLGGSATGGSRMTGGSSATGGKSTGAGGSSGGVSGVGGNPRTGGSTATGGSKSTGGVSSAGGTTAAGGTRSAVGGSATGGLSTLGGTFSAGGSSSTGGASGVAGSSAAGSSSTTLNGCTAAISDATLNDEYAKWTKAYVRDCTTAQARVQAGGSATGSESSETFSEGIGYGMLLAVSFNDKPTFEKLWAYYKAARNTNGLMNWKMNACTGNFYEGNGASDGDLDTAMALVKGDRLWGGFGTDTNTLLDAIHTSETMECSGQTVLRPGDAWGLECTTGSLNPSYFSPGYYRAFAIYQPSQASFWNKFADDTVKLLLDYQQDAGGALMGEWSYVDRLADTSYGYNACRTPWRVAVDYAWWGTAGSKTFLTNVSAYVDSKNGVANVPFDKNSAFLGPFALSGLSTGKCDAYYQSWMTGAQYDDRYFQGTLRVLTMLVMAGKFTF